MAQSTTRCPGCGSVNHLHFWVRVGTEIPAKLVPCPFETEEK
jgi:hypothetical protein